MKKLIGIILGILVIAGIVCGVLVSGVTISDEDHTITVEPGDGTLIIANKLAESGAVASATVFTGVVKVSGNDEAWFPGEYVIPGKSSCSEIIELLSVPSESLRVTIPEGKQVRQIATILEDAGVCSSEEFLEACQSHDFAYEFLENVPANERIGGLEGYLFPDTYYFEKDEDVDRVIETMLDNFEEKVWTDEVRAAAKEMDMSVDELIILASMVESEATTQEDRKLVAGVFLNRLENSDEFPLLQSCVTVEYAKGIKKAIISLEDTQYDSPYNTYMYPGLPYGPICCPSMESIEAVMNPTESDYYYFQSDSDGNLHFASSFDEHSSTQEDVQSNWEE